MAKRTECVIVGCNRPWFCREWCRHHYTRWRNYGDPGHYPDRSEVTRLGWEKRQPLDMTATHRRCTSCQEMKPLSDFHRQNREGGGSSRSRRHARCKPCFRELVRTWGAQNADKKAATDWAYSIRKYGLTPATWQKLFDAQRGCCAICDRKITRSAHIDHDHACCGPNRACQRCVRGLLCIRCNIGLGYFSDNAGQLLLAANYIMTGGTHIVHHEPSHPACKVGRLPDPKDARA